ncbi:MAG: MFS transporter, partial [Anaerolineae bacterium]|nr:MFS transporter [Anaerolineae bacterium]
WTLEGTWRLAVIGWVSSLVLAWRLRYVSTTSERQRDGVQYDVLPEFRRLFLPLAAVLLLRDFMLTGMSTFLAVMLEGQGYTLDQASAALSLWFFAGVAGALSGGTVSDRIGRKRTLAIALTGAGVLLLVFLHSSGWVMIPVLLLLGFTGLSVTPVVHALVLEHLPEHRATGSGLFMLTSSVIRLGTAPLIGVMGDSVGLWAVFLLAAVLTLAAVPLVWLLPNSDHRQATPAD